jgi:prephenate dehydrogenase
MVKQLALIGCGLIGGSFALALKSAAGVDRVFGFSSTESTLIRAKKMGVIDQISPSAGAAVRGADLVLIAVPVGAMPACFSAIADHLEPQALVMDVGSTKENIARLAKQLLGDKLPQFVPAHPVAGKELAGVEHAVADLFLNRPLILTPLAQTKLQWIDRAHKIWSSLGALVHNMSVDEHDRAFAAVSHLPHFIAFAYMNGLISQQQHENFLSVAGPGFKDFSRIAGADPKVWSDIFFDNAANLKEQIFYFKKELDRLEQVLTLKDETGMAALIESSKKARLSWSQSKGLNTP